MVKDMFVAQSVSGLCLIMILYLAEVEQLSTKACAENAQDAKKRDITMSVLRQGSD